VTFPEPRVGLVIRYAYLWRDEARAGREEGRKDRPCVIVIATPQGRGRVLATVAPITHLRPTEDEAANAVELPAATKARLGLDDLPSWALASDLNQFVWPGVDLRPATRDGEHAAYGFLPATLTEALRARILRLAQSGAELTTQRTDVDG